MNSDGEAELAELLVGSCPDQRRLAALIATLVLLVFPEAAFISLEAASGITRLGTIFDATRQPVCLGGAVVSVDETRDAGGHLDAAADAAALLTVDAGLDGLLAAGFGSPTVLDLRRALEVDRIHP